MRQFLPLLLLAACQTGPTNGTTAGGAVLAKSFLFQGYTDHPSETVTLQVLDDPSHDPDVAANWKQFATAVTGTDPTIMLTGPVPASRKALDKAGLTVEDLDLVEVNEAFASVVLRFLRHMGLDMEKVNVNGGAIAMGHPLGATGAMILGTLIDELHRTGGRYGLATLCVGGGMGIATVVEATR